MLQKIPVVLDWANRVASGIYFHISKVILMIIRAAFGKIHARDQARY